MGEFRGLFAIGRREASRTGDLLTARRQRCMGLVLSQSGFLQKSPCLKQCSCFIQSSICCSVIFEGKINRRLGFLMRKTKVMILIVKLFRLFLSANRIKIFPFFYGAGNLGLVWSREWFWTWFFKTAQFHSRHSFFTKKIYIDWKSRKKIELCLRRRLCSTGLISGIVHFLRRFYIFAKFL